MTTMTDRTARIRKRDKTARREGRASQGRDVDIYHYPSIYTSLHSSICPPPPPHPVRQ
jgi:hypothetical protein